MNFYIFTFKVQQVELRVICRGDEIVARFVLHENKNMNSHEGICRCNMFPGHFLVCEVAVILSLLHVPGKCPNTNNTIQYNTIRDYSLPSGLFRTNQLQYCFGDFSHTACRLPAVPFWIVERAREPKTHSAARLEQGLRLFTLLFGYFARPLDYPERDCKQSILLVTQFSIRK